MTFYEWLGRILTTLAAMWGAGVFAIIATDRITRGGLETISTIILAALVAMAAALFMAMWLVWGVTLLDIFPFLKVEK